MPKEASQRKFKTQDGHVYVPVNNLDKHAIKTIAQVITPDHPEEKVKVTTARVVVDEATGEHVVLVGGYKTKPKDRSKRILKNPTAVAEENIIHGTRRRRNVNYKECTEKEQGVSESHNTYEERQVSAKKKNSSSKKSKKNQTKKAEQDVDQEKENINQQEQQTLEEEETIPKKSRPKSRNKKVKEEVPQTSSWSYALSPKVCELITKLGGEIPSEVKKHRYRDMILSDAINLFASIKWKKGNQFIVEDKSKVKDEDICVEHQIFVMDQDQYEHIEWFKEKNDFIFLGDGDAALCVCRLSESSEDFPIYLVMEACDGLPEEVFKFSLSEYLSMLRVKEENSQDDDLMQL
nr:unnamed protein product [Naegleria fowleri]